MLRPRSMRHSRVPSSLYASSSARPERPADALSREFDGSHLSTISYSPSPSRSPTLASLELYVNAETCPPGGTSTLPPAGRCNGTLRYGRAGEFAGIVNGVLGGMSAPYSTGCTV